MDISNTTTGTTPASQSPNLNVMTTTSTSTSTIICCCGPYTVQSPPIKKQMISGHLLPTLRSATAISMLQQPKRQISIIVVRNNNTSTAATTTTTTTTTATTASSSSSSSLSTTTNQISHLHNDDQVILRICRLASEIPTSPKHNNDDGISSSSSSNENNVASSSSSAAATTTTTTLMNDMTQQQHQHWVEHKVYRLEEVQVLKQRKDSIEVQLGFGNETIVRDFKFIMTNTASDEGYVSHFCSMIVIMKQLEQKRAMQQMQQYKLSLLQQQQEEEKNSSSTTSNSIKSIEKPTKVPNATSTKIQLLVEIVSITNLPISDLLSTDAYVVVRLGTKEIHRTAVISKNLSPIYTLLTGSLFTIVYPSMEEFFRAATSGLSFTIKDYDSVGSNDLIGTVQVPIQQLLNGDGQRIPYPIILANNHRPTSVETESDVMDTSVNKAKKKEKKKGKGSAEKMKKVPTLYLRYKHATQHDIDFIHEFISRCSHGGSNNKFSKPSNSICGIYASETFLSIRVQPLSNNILHRHEKRNKNKELMYRAKPCPDPNRPLAETEWLTEREIEHEVLQPSTYWVEAGYGNIGKLFLEIIGCDNLPNMDVGNISLKLPHKDLTDTFACIVYEDVIVNTDVIVDSLSPRWMPWCHRAFAINMLHPSSDVFIGIFDHDNEHNPLHAASQIATSLLHDPIGRIVINLSHFKPDTVYLLQYPLYFGELKEHRKETRGTVTVRLRLEFPNVRNAIMVGVTPPPPSTVSVSRRIDFDVAHYTTDGIIDDREFSLDTLSRYIEELQTYQSITEYIKEAVLVIWLWRGHYPVVVAGTTFKLPIHSITAYTWAILVTWNWNRLPAFWAFSVAWFLIATNEYQIQHPSRWHNCPTYYSLLDAFVRNKSSSEFIQSNANIDAINAYTENLNKKLRRTEEETKKEAEHEAEIQKELGEEIQAAEAAEEVGRKRGGILSTLVPDHPLKGILFPIQKQLREIVFGTRIIKTVIIWKEAYYAFWITTVAFGTSIAVFWIPWSFLLRWLFRFIAIVAMGPWMAIVDYKYFKIDPNLSEAKRDKILSQKLRQRYEEVVLSATNYFQRKERAMKRASMKKYMFGQYSVRVPQFCEDLFDDIPLPSSSCYPYDPSQHKPIQIQKVIYGQTLKGDMIPARESETATSQNVKSIGPKTTVGKKDAKKPFPFFGQVKKRPEETAPLLVHEDKSNPTITYDSIKKPL